jgi:hypothetical protein
MDCEPENRPVNLQLAKIRLAIDYRYQSGIIPRGQAGSKGLMRFFQSPYLFWVVAMSGKPEK